MIFVAGRKNPIEFNVEENDFILVCTTNTATIDDLLRLSSENVKINQFLADGSYILSKE